MAPTSSNSFCESPPRLRPARGAPPSHAQLSSVASWSKGTDKASSYSASTAFSSKAAPPLPVHAPAPLPFPTSTTSTPVPSRPGMGSRTSSALSINTFNAVSNGDAMRKPSIVAPHSTNGDAPHPPAKGAPVVHLPPLGSVMGGAWTAPDSWAVHPEAGASLDHDSSDDDDGDLDDEDHDRETEGSEDGMSPIPESGVKAFGMMGEDAGTGLGLRPGTSGTRSGMNRNGRPGTADGEGRKGSQKNVRPAFVLPYRIEAEPPFCSSWFVSTASTTPSPPSPSP
jgi:hypothetical protein